MSYSCDVDDVIRRLTPKVRHFAFRLSQRLPVSVSQDDLFQAGMVGLLDAIRAFDSSAGGDFNGYAMVRIRGSMIDELRSMDWATRSLRAGTRCESEARRILQHRLGREPSSHELSEEMGIGLDEYRQHQFECRVSRIEYIEDIRPDTIDDAPPFDIADPSDPVDVVVERMQAMSALQGFINGLTGKSRQVVEACFESHGGQVKMCKALSLSESRISQIRKAAAIELSTKMRESGYIL